MRNKLISLLFLILITITISGCEDQYEYGEPVDLELLVTEYDLPQETENLLQNYDIVNIFDLDGDYYIVYRSVDDVFLVRLDDEFYVEYELNDFGSIHKLQYDDNGLLEVTHQIEDTHIDIIKSDGTRLVSMNVSYPFIKTTDRSQPFYSERYLSLENGSYLYVDKTARNTTNNTFKLIKTDGTNEIVLHEFMSQYQYDIYVLSNDTIVFSYKQSSDFLDTLIHMELDGTVIKQEEINLMNIEILSDGYLLELFGSGASYHHIRRDLSSNKVWEYTSDFLNFKEETEEYLFFTAHSNNGFDSIHIYNDGTYNTFIDEDDAKYPEAMRKYLDEDTFINIDYSNYSDDLYEVTLYSKNEDVVKQIDYTYRVEEIIRDDVFYIHGYDGENTIIDIYNFHGELLNTKILNGHFVSITDEGEYVTVTEDGILQKISTIGESLWQVDTGFSNVSYSELYDDVFMISEKIFSPLSAFPNEILIPSYIINDQGDIITDLTDKEGIGLISVEEDSFYMYQPKEKLLYQFNNSGIITQEIDIVCYSFGSLYHLENGKLIVYDAT